MAAGSVKGAGFALGRGQESGKSNGFREGRGDGRSLLILPWEELSEAAEHEGRTLLF